jgi:hypothetical protein
MNGSADDFQSSAQFATSGVPVTRTWRTPPFAVRLQDRPPGVSGVMAAYVKTHATSEGACVMPNDCPLSRR